jgi:GNAT superfamily N-acetyltransferase
VRRKTRNQLRKLGITPEAVYEGDETPGLLSEPGARIVTLPGGYVLALAEVSPYEDDDDDLSDDEDDQDEPLEFEDLVYYLSGELISVSEKKVVGRSTNQIISLEAVVSIYHPDDVFAFFDSRDQAKANLYEELTTRRALKFLLDDPGGSLLHLERLTIEERHRGTGLGLRTLEAVIGHAARGMGCAHAIMKPFPLQFEGGEPRDAAGRRAWGREFREGARKLSLYYQRLGFAPPSARSEYLYKRIRD